MTIQSSIPQVGDIIMSQDGLTAGVVVDDGRPVLASWPWNSPTILDLGKGWHVSLPGPVIILHRPQDPAQTLGL